MESPTVDVTMEARSLVAEQRMADKSAGAKRMIYEKVLHYMEEEKIYLDPRLSLIRFSTVIGTNTTYLSSTINEYFGCNLKSLINRYRIEYAKQLLLQTPKRKVQPNQIKTSDFKLFSRKTKCI